MKLVDLKTSKYDQSSVSHEKCTNECVKYMVLLLLFFMFVTVVFCCCFFVCCCLVVVVICYCCNYPIFNIFAYTL